MKTEISKHESTTQPGLFFWAESNGGGAGPAESYGVISQAAGFPATEAHDDWFANFKDADEIAQRLAGIAPTPGPWVAVRSDEQTAEVCRMGGDIRSRIALCSAGALADEHGGSIDANARLIAAAPDLLEALTGLLANCPAPKRIRADFSYTLYREAAQRAIAKATGSTLSAASTAGRAGAEVKEVADR